MGVADILWDDAGFSPRKQPIHYLDIVLTFEQIQQVLPASSHITISSIALHLFIAHVYFAGDGGGD
jgi:hypothetical protein